MKAATRKTPTRKPAPKPARKVKRTAAERKAKAIELILIAIASGWTITRFARHAHIQKGTLLRWLAEDTVQPRFIRAMQAKALILPDTAMEIVEKILTGKVDPKAGRAALSHIEFRMMREIKAGYQASAQLNVVTDAREMSDQELDAKFNDLMKRYQHALPAGGGDQPGQENDGAAG